jgi:hypothetical protein
VAEPVEGGAPFAVEALAQEGKRGARRGLARGVEGGPRLDPCGEAAGEPEAGLGGVGGGGHGGLPGGWTSPETIILGPSSVNRRPVPGGDRPGHADTLEALLAWLAAMRPSRFVLAERSGMGETRSVLERAGVPHLAAR